MIIVHQKYKSILEDYVEKEQLVIPENIKEVEEENVFIGTFRGCSDFDQQHPGTNTFFLVVDQLNCIERDKLLLLSDDHNQRVLIISTDFGENYVRQQLELICGEKRGVEDLLFHMNKFFREEQINELDEKRKFLESLNEYYEQKNFLKKVETSKLSFFSKYMVGRGKGTEFIDFKQTKTNLLIYSFSVNSGLLGLDLVSSLCRLTSEGKIKYQDLLEVFISNPDVNFVLMEISTSKLKAKYAKKGDYKIISSLRDMDQSLERDEVRLKAGETFAVSSPGINAISDLNISNKINNSTQGDAVSLFTDIFSEIKYKIDKGEFSQDSLMFILEVAKNAISPV